MCSAELHSGDPEYKNTLKNGSEDPPKQPNMANEEIENGNAANAAGAVGGNGTLPTDNAPNVHNAPNAQALEAEARIQNALAAQAQAQRALDAALAVHAVKLPPFWPDKIEVWFAQAEAQFILGKITREDTKYAHVMAKLDAKLADQVLDIIRERPINPYTRLKERLTEAYEITDDEKAGRLLDLNGLGDKTPSQGLTDMLNLVPRGQEPGFLFRKIFLRQLPSDVRSHLAQSSNRGTTKADLRALALEADRHFSSMGSRISAVSRISGKDLRVVGEEFDDCGINAVSGPGKTKLCFYHTRFADKAQKCEPQCPHWSKFKQRSGATSGSTAFPVPGNSRPGRVQPSN